MEQENEPKPGYLSQNLDGHKEPVPEKAWEGIEVGLDRKKRRGIFYWLFGTLGVLLLGTSLWFFQGGNQEVAMNPNPKGTEQKQAVNPQLELKTEKSEPVDSKPSITPSQEDQTGSDRALTQSKAKPEIENGPKSEVNPRTRKAESGSSKSTESKALTLKEAHPKSRKPASDVVGENLQTVSGDHPETDIQRPITESKSKRSKTAEKRKSSVPAAALIPQNQKPEKPDFNLKNGSQESDNQIDLKSGAEKPKTEDQAGNLLNPPQTQTSETIPPIGNNIESTDVKKDESEKPTATSLNPMQAPIDSSEGKKTQLVESAASKSASDSIPKTNTNLLVKTDSVSTPKPDTNLSKPWKRDPFWLISVNAGFMQQSGDLQQDYFNNAGQPMVSVSPSDISTAPSIRLAISHLWQVTRSFWIGIECSANGIFQQANAILNPSEESPIKYTYGTDSLTIVAETGYQNQHQSYKRQSFILGLFPRAQWKPQWSPVGLQGRFRLASVTFVQTQNEDLAPYPGSNWEYGNNAEIGLWIPVRKRGQISLDFNRLNWTGQSLPVPVQNQGKNWIISAGFGWKW